MNEEMSGLESILLGNSAESAASSPAQLAARVAAAQKAMVKLKKAEKKVRKDDKVLAKLVKTLSFDQIKVIATFISAEVPSGVILALLSLTEGLAARFCAKKFDNFVEEWAFVENLNPKIQNSAFETVNLAEKTKNLPVLAENEPNNAKMAEKLLGQWWTYVIMADHVAGDEKLAKTSLRPPLWGAGMKYFALLVFGKPLPAVFEAFSEKYASHLFPSGFAEVEIVKKVPETDEFDDF